MEPRHFQSSSSSHMHVMNHNWSATKQRLHPQNVAEISRHSVLPGNRIQQCRTSSGSRHKDRSVSVSRHFLLPAPQCPCSVRIVQQRPLLPREVKTRLPDCGSHTRWELTTWADFQFAADNPSTLSCMIRRARPVAWIIIIIIIIT